MSDEIDPSIAALLSETEDSLPQQKALNPSDSLLSNVVEDNSFDLQLEKQKAALKNLQAQAKSVSTGPKSIHEPDLNVKQFAPITKFFEDTPSKDYDDPAYYKTCLSGEGDRKSVV